LGGSDTVEVSGRFTWNGGSFEGLKLNARAGLFITHGSEHMLGDVSVSGIGEKHAEIHRSIPLSSNLGYLIDSTLWYPGDAFTNPHRPIDVLALPVSGPWMKIG
jgi:hypothetical protein